MNELLVLSAGLTGLRETIINNWIGPVFLVAVAACAIVFIKDRAWMKLLGFVGIAAVVGVLVFGGSTLFGGNESGSSGKLSKFVENEAGKIGG